MDHPVLRHRGNLWAVFIGVTTYDDPSWWSLPYCDNDATALADVFGDQARSGYPATHIQLLAATASTRSLQPTCRNIRAAIGRVVTAAGPEDTILIGFFGHGAERDGQSYLFPSDGWRVSHDQAIALPWIQHELTRARARFRIFLCDTCHSGTLRHRGAPEPMTFGFAEALTLLRTSEGWAVLSACMQDEVSHDYEEKAHGVFTYFLLEGLRGAADTDGDGLITVPDASRYASSRTKDWALTHGLQQNPTLLYNVSGDIVLLHSLDGVRVPGAGEAEAVPQGQSRSGDGSAPRGRAARPVPDACACRVLLVKRRGDAVSVLHNGDVLTTADAYGVFFQPAQASFVYVLQQDARGAIDVLFPDPQWSSQTNPVPAGQAVWVPQDINHWFYLDTNVGEEVLMVVATLERHTQLEALLPRLDEANAVQELLAWLHAPERGRAGVRRYETQPYAAPDGRVVSLETVLVQANGMDMVEQVVFQHR